MLKQMKTKYHQPGTLYIIWTWQVNRIAYIFWSSSYGYDTVREMCQIVYKWSLELMILFSIPGNTDNMNNILCPNKFDCWYSLIKKKSCI